MGQNSLLKTFKSSGKWENLRLLSCLIVSMYFHTYGMRNHINSTLHIEHFKRFSDSTVGGVIRIGSFICSTFILFHGGSSVINLYAFICDLFVLSMDGSSCWQFPLFCAPKPTTAPMPCVVEAKGFPVYQCPAHVEVVV